MMLSVEDLQIHYATRDGVARAVDGACFQVPEGKIVGLVGESGCGKTTAVRAIMGVLSENGRRAGGRVVFKGTADRREEHPAAAVARDRLRAAKRHELARPGLYGRRADRRGADQARRRLALGREGARRPSCSTWWA